MAQPRQGLRGRNSESRLHRVVRHKSDAPNGISSSAGGAVSSIPWGGLSTRGRSPIRTKEREKSVDKNLSRMRDERSNANLLFGAASHQIPGGATLPASSCGSACAISSERPNSWMSVLLLTVFTTEGGISTRTQRTYVNTECPHITESISQPYLAWGVID